MNLDSLNNLRSKVDALGDILECPVCFERLSGDIPQCTQGHHVCRKCLIRLFQCPLCNSRFNGTRNYLAENVLTKFEEIKSALTNLNQPSNVVLCAEPKKPEPAVIVLEKFPCIIDDCFEKHTYNHMIDHIRYDHGNILFEAGVVNSCRFTNWWSIDHECATSWEKIIYIKNMGIFFLKINISNKGNVYGYVQNASGSKNNQVYYYELEVQDSSVDFNGPVVSTAIPHTNGKYAFIGYALNEDDDGDDYFNLDVTITRLH